MRRLRRGAFSSPPHFLDPAPSSAPTWCSPHHARGDQSSPLRRGSPARAFIPPSPSSPWRPSEGAREHPSQVWPSSARSPPGLPPLWRESPSPPEALKALQTCPCPFLPSPRPSLPLTPSAAATRAFSLFLRHVSPVLPQDVCTGCAPVPGVPSSHVIIVPHPASLLCLVPQPSRPIPLMSKCRKLEEAVQTERLGHGRWECETGRPLWKRVGGSSKS